MASFAVAHCWSSSVLSSTGLASCLASIGLSLSGYSSSVGTGTGSNLPVSEMVDRQGL